MMIFASSMASATTYTLKVSTDSASYSGAASIKITGSVSPAPGASTGVTLKLINPTGVVLGVWTAGVGASSGEFNYTLTAGGTSSWTAGTYTVNATWGAYPPQLYAQTTFTYSTAITTTTTTSTTTSTTSSTTSSSPSTTLTSTQSTPSSTTTTSSGGGGIPEFPFQAVSAGLLVAAVAVGYLIVRKRSLTGSVNPSPR